MSLRHFSLLAVLLLLQVSGEEESSGNAERAQSASDETCTSEETCAEKASVPQLLDWLHAGGGSVTGAILRDEPGKERGLFAATDLEEGAKVLSVPAMLAITVERAAATPLGLDLLQAAVDGHVHDEKSLDGLLLAAWLLHETNQPDTTFSTYLDALPRSLSSPFNLTRSGVQECVGGLSAEDYILKGQETLDKELALMQSLPSSSTVNLSRDRYLWARFMTFSRTFTVSRIRLHMDSTISGLPEMPRFAQKLWNDAKVSDEASVIVPVADMLNHGQSVNCDWKYSGESGFTITTNRPVAAGQELLITYGAKQNQLFLAHYGFIDAGAPGDQWDLPLQISTDQAADTARVVLKVDAGSPTPPEDLQELLNAFRKQAQKELGLRDDAESVSSGGVATADVEAKALRLFAAALRREVETYDASDSGLPVCVAYRENSRRLLGTWLVFAERAAALIEGVEPPDDSWLTVPRFLRYVRLYFGLWLNGQGGGRLAKSREAYHQARAYGKMSFFQAVYSDD